MKRDLQKVAERRNRHLELISKKQDFIKLVNSSIEGIAKDSGRASKIQELKKEYSRKSL